MSAGLFAGMIPGMVQTGVGVAQGGLEFLSELFNQERNQQAGQELRDLAGTQQFQYNHQVLDHFRNAAETTRQAGQAGRDALDQASSSIQEHGNAAKGYTSQGADRASNELTQGEQRATGTLRDSLNQGLNLLGQGTNRAIGELENGQGLSIGAIQEALGKGLSQYTGIVEAAQAQTADVLNRIDGFQSLAAEAQAEIRAAVQASLDRNNAALDEARMRGDQAIAEFTTGTADLAGQQIGGLKRSIETEIQRYQEEARAQGVSKTDIEAEVRRMREGARRQTTEVLTTAGNKINDTRLAIRTDTANRLSQMQQTFGTLAQQGVSQLLQAGSLVTEAGRAGAELAQGAYNYLTGTMMGVADRKSELYQGAGAAMATIYNQTAGAKASLIANSAQFGAGLATTVGGQIAGTQAAFAGQRAGIEMQAGMNLANIEGQMGALSAQVLTAKSSFELNAGINLANMETTVANATAQSLSLLYDGIRQAIGVEIGRAFVPPNFAALTGSGLGMVQSSISSWQANNQSPPQDNSWVSGLFGLGGSAIGASATIDAATIMAGG